MLVLPMAIGVFIIVGVDAVVIMALVLVEPSVGHCAPDGFGVVYEYVCVCDSCVRGKKAIIIKFCNNIPFTR